MRGFDVSISFQVYQLCHIVLGLRPLTRRDEGEIVRGWLEREERAPLMPGALWHLVNMDWWAAWHAYVNYHDSPNVSGGRAGSGGSDLVSHHKRGSRKTPSIDSTLATDENKGVVGTSYQQLSEDQQGSKVGKFNLL